MTAASSSFRSSGRTGDATSWAHAYIPRVERRSRDRHESGVVASAVPAHTFVHWCDHRTRSTLSYTGPRSAAQLATGSRVVLPEGLVYSIEGSMLVGDELHVFVRWLPEETPNP